MIGQIALALFLLVALFILFLVISKTMNSILNVLFKLEYLLKKEVELKNEALEVRKIMIMRQREQDELQRVRRELDEE